MKWLFGVVILLSGCAARVPAIPHTARDQIPAEAGPSTAWRASGRLVVTWPGGRISADIHVRHDADRVQAVVLADGGLRLAELTVDGNGARATSVIAGLTEHGPQLAALLLPYLSATPASAWHGAHRRCTYPPGWTRWYGGDPVRVLAMEGPNGWLSIADYDAHGLARTITHGHCTLTLSAASP